MAPPDSGRHRPTWSVVRLDPDAERWSPIAHHAFWLRFPAALDSESPTQASGMEEFRRYGVELNVLEHDLTECLNEFKQSYEVLYQDPRNIAQKKFSIVYHVDNFL